MLIIQPLKRAAENLRNKYSVVIPVQGINRAFDAWLNGAASTLETATDIDATCISRYFFRQLLSLFMRSISGVIV